MGKHEAGFFWEEIAVVQCYVVIWRGFYEHPIGLKLFWMFYPVQFNFFVLRETIFFQISLGEIPYSSKSCELFMQMKTSNKSLKGHVIVSSWVRW